MLPERTNSKQRSMPRNKEKLSHKLNNQKIQEDHKTKTYQRRIATKKLLGSIWELSILTKAALLLEVAQNINKRLLLR